MTKTRRRRIPPDLLNSAATTMRAIAHPLRLRLLEILEEVEVANVTALCEASGAPQPAVSQQLARMRREGVLAAERRGNEVHYRVARPAVLGVLECIRKMGRAGRK